MSEPEPEERQLSRKPLRVSHLKLAPPAIPLRLCSPEAVLTREQLAARERALQILSDRVRRRPPDILVD